jgi:hypothetical protein
MEPRFCDNGALAARLIKVAAVVQKYANKDQQINQRQLEYTGFHSVASAVGPAYASARSGSIRYVDFFTALILLVCIR